jgi:hypothetical protein
MPRVNRIITNAADAPAFDVAAVRLLQSAEQLLEGVGAIVPDDAHHVRACCAALRHRCEEFRRADDTPVA